MITPFSSTKVGLLTIVGMLHVSLLIGCVPPGHLPGQLLHQPEAKHPGESERDQLACCLLLAAAGGHFFFHLVVPEQIASMEMEQCG